MSIFDMAASGDLGFSQKPQGAGRKGGGMPKRAVDVHGLTSALKSVWGG